MLGFLFYVPSSGLLDLFVLADVKVELPQILWPKASIIV